jgi:hypothetical protein
MVFKTPLKNLHRSGVAKTRMMYSMVNQEIQTVSIMNKYNGSRHSGPLS